MTQFKKDTLIIFESDDYKNRFGKSRICGRIESVQGITADIILFGMVGPGDETLLKDVPLENISLDNWEHYVFGTSVCHHWGRVPNREPTCPCYEIENRINVMYPNADWDRDEACEEWLKRKKLIQSADPPLVFEDWDDRHYGCTCPACGYLVCGHCV